MATLRDSIRLAFVALAALAAANVSPVHAAERPLVISGATLVDVRNARRVRQVIKGGIVFEHDALRSARRVPPCGAGPQ